MPTYRSGFFGRGNEWLDSPTFTGTKTNYPRITPTGTTGQPMQAAKAATSFNLGSVGDIGKLTESLNNMNQQAQRAALNARNPNQVALDTQSSKNILAELQGQLNPDDLNYLGQAAAERGVGRGIGGDSQNTQAAYLRALGLTRFDRQKQGQADLTAADARNPIAPIVDASKYTLTPKESADINLAYLSEADRVALENQRLLYGGGGGGYRGGGGGYGGGYGGPGGGGSDWFPFQDPGIVVGRATQPTGITGGDVYGNPNFTTQDWISSLGNYKPYQGSNPQNQNGYNYEDPFTYG